MSNLYNSNLKTNARKLRKNMTQEERKLWYCFLKNLPQTFYRQKPLGKYIADFYCPSSGIVIEADGTQHFETRGTENDRERDDYFYQLGIKVLRFSNKQINTDFENVCKEITRYLK